MNTGKPGERAIAEKAIVDLPRPASDPIDGSGGSLPRLYADALRKEQPA
jgi:uncharacterized protein YjlB